jgi:alpha-L-rhamnosidase
MIVYNVIKLYEYYHDIDVVKDSYDKMKKYVGYLTSIAKGHIVEWGLGDWMEPFRTKKVDRPTTTPVSLTSTVAYYFYAHKMAMFAKLLGKEEDATYFNGLAEKIKQSYNQRFLNIQTGQYAQGSEAGQLMSLHFGLVPNNERKLVIQKLKALIKEHNGHLSTGFVATPILLTTLCDIGLEKEAYIMTTKKDFPSWFDMIFNGDNSVMKENWKGGLVQMPSLAEPIGYWFYNSLAGIKSLAPGFKKIAIRPDFIQNLSWVSARYQSIQGTIISKWKREKMGLQLHVEIPANATALVYLPTTNPDAILESNKKIKGRHDMSIKAITNNETVVSVGSGSYSFVVDPVKP